MSALPCGTLLFLASFLLHIAGVKTAEEPVPIQTFSSGSGGSVIFPLQIAPGTSFSNLFWRTSMRVKAVAIWVPGKPLITADPWFAERVTFSEETFLLAIKNLTLADGEIYTVSMARQNGVETVLQKYRLLVLHVTGEGEKFANGSCSLDLECQAGAGPTASVTYSWKDTKTGAPLAQSSRLHELLPPQDKERSFSCTARTDSVEGVWDVAPYGKFCISRSGAAGLFLPGLLPYHYVTKAALLPALVAVLLLP